MAVEDPAAMRAIHGSTVLHPSDANHAAKLVAEMADRSGIWYIRTLRGKTPVRTPPDKDVRPRLRFAGGPCQHWRLGAGGQARRA